MQAGGERAGRRIFLTIDDARAIAAQSSMVDVVSPEIERQAVSVKSLYNSASPRVTGIEPPYQDIRTIELESGRHFTWLDEEQVARVAIIGDDVSDQLFWQASSGRRNRDDERPALRGRRQDAEERSGQQLQAGRTTPRSSCRSPPCSATCRAGMRIRASCPTSSSRQSRTWSIDCRRCSMRGRGRIEDIDWPLVRDVRSILARQHGFDPADLRAIDMWDTSLNSLMFGRMIDRMRDFFTIVGMVDAGAWRHRRDEYHAGGGKGAHA